METACTWCADRVKIRRRQRIVRSVEFQPEPGSGNRPGGRSCRPVSPAGTVGHRGRVHRVRVPDVYKRPPSEGDRMRTYAKMSSGPEPLLQHGSEGRHAKASSPPGQDPDSAPEEPAAGAADENDHGEPGHKPAISPLPRRVAGQSRVVAHPAGPPGVIRSARVSGGPPWEPALKPPDVSYAPKHGGTPGAGTAR